MVEIDPAVTRAAKRFFDFRDGPRMKVIEQDGRVYVKRAGRAGERYDLVMLDAFDHEYIPEHLLTREFLDEVRVLLGSSGVLVGEHVLEQPPVRPRVDHVRGCVRAVLQPEAREPRHRHATWAGCPMRRNSSGDRCRTTRR